MTNIKNIQAEFNKSINSFVSLLDKVKIEASNDVDKRMVENIRVDVTNALNLAKKGDQQAINEIVNRYASQVNK
jgi:predicted HicB family RNase H-like nuclease